MGYSTRCKLATVAAAVVVVVAVVLIVVFTMQGTSENPWDSEIRLPPRVVPIRYDILLHPDIDQQSDNFGNFTGTVNIELEMQENREWFVVHAKYLAITKYSLTNTNGSVPMKEPMEVQKNEWWVMRPDGSSFPSGSYTLTLEFAGQLTRGIVGFYQSKYLDASGAQRYIATTKFEPTYARLAFPCFDEPAMKASYKVRLVKPISKEYIALSNSDVKSSSNDLEKNLTTVEFTETVKMSSYLAAFIVCDFEKQNNVIKSGKPVTIYARKEQIGSTSEALNVAVQVVDYYADYFGIEYPMPKVDLIAIPDFVSGAMENWGLITFRETSVLFDPSQNSPGTQESISETTAHELAHMWFGNLVTMKWWTDLWLNEGFATFMAQKSINHIHNDWNYIDQFVVTTLLSILDLDASLSSHPVLQEVSNPDQITEIFDTISYDKGSSVILMLETFMGESNFLKGLKTYLKTHQYSNAETSDLWKALQDYAPGNVNVAKVMDTWTRQMGFPLLTVKRTSANTFSVTQKRFLANPEAKSDSSTSKFGYKWEVPIFYATSLNQDNALVWLYSNQESVEIPASADIAWIKLNYNQRCYYRVNYDDEGWQALIKILTENTEAIKAVDRAGLISDAFSLADAEEIKYKIALDLTKYLVYEKEFVPWYSADTVIRGLLKHLPESEVLKTYFLKQINPRLSEFSWSVTPSKHLERRLRTSLFGLACELRSPSALKEASELFSVWLKGGNKPQPDIRSVVYTYGLGDSQSKDLWDQVFEKFREETNTQEKTLLMKALAQTQNVTLLKDYLTLAKDESIIRSQDYFSVLYYICANPKGVQLVWDFYRDEYDNYLLPRFSLNDRTFGRFISRMAGQFNTEERLKEMKDFFEKHPEAGAGAAARKQALETVENNIKWLQTHRKEVEEWLTSA